MVMVVMHHGVVVVHRAMVHSVMPGVRRGRAGADRQEQGGRERRC